MTKILQCPLATRRKGNMFRAHLLLIAAIDDTRWLMIVSLNGWPGVGKLTVGTALADLLGARLLDNHTMFNVAIALTDFATPAYYAAARAVRDVAFACAAALPAGVPVVLTGVTATGGTMGFAEEHWAAVRALADCRGVPLVSVTLECDAVENARRIVAPGRRALRKLRDPAILAALTAGRALFDEGADYRYRVDTTDIAPDACARHIAAWMREALAIRTGSTS